MQAGGTRGLAQKALQSDQVIDVHGAVAVEVRIDVHDRDDVKSGLQPIEVIDVDDAVVV